jgi:putative membrane protein
MKDHAVGALTIVAAIALASCSGGTPTSPSALPGGTPGTFAQVSGSGDARTLAQISPAAGSSDAAFVSFAAAANQSEIELGNLAQRAGDHPAVKFFGAQLVQDHTAALLALRDVAPNNVSQTVTTNTAQQQTFNTLSQMTGSTFDRAFVPMMIQSHEATIARFQQQAQSGDPALRDYAQGYLSSLMAHLRMAQDLATFIR